MVDDATRHAHLFTFSGSNKAGMTNVDTSKQAAVIYEMSKNSEYFKRAAQQDEKVNIRVEEMKRMLAGVTWTEEKRCESTKRLAAAELKRNFNRICCVLDMDMFYAAVEIRDNPSLRALPIAVGGLGMISTTNYIARQYGVRSAMPGFIGKRLCPDLVFVKPNFEKYEQVGRIIRAIISNYDPFYKSSSLDEVYMDLTTAAIARLDRGRASDDGGTTSPGATDVAALRIMACDLLQEIRARVKEATGGLTCSAGIANNFMLAKVCADCNKPDGQYELPATRSAVIEFVHRLPTRKIGGIGKVTEKMLRALGMETMGDVHENIHKIVHSFTPATAQFLTRACIGVGAEEGDAVPRRSVLNEGIMGAMRGQAPHGSRQANRDVTTGGSSGVHGSGAQIEGDQRRERKSIGAERTFAALSHPPALRDKLREICGFVEEALVEHDTAGHTVTLKLKTSKFELLTRSTTLRRPVRTRGDMEPVAMALLEALLPAQVRLLGVSVSKLVPTGSGPALAMLDFFAPRNGALVNRLDGGHRRGEDGASWPSQSTSGCDNEGGVLLGDPKSRGENGACVARDQGSEVRVSDDAGDRDGDEQQQEEEEEEEEEVRSIIFNGFANADAEPHKDAVASNVPPHSSTTTLSSSSSSSSLSSKRNHESSASSSNGHEDRNFKSPSIGAGGHGGSARARWLMTERCEFRCPVCTRPVLGTAVALNAHIDRCLQQQQQQQQGGGGGGLGGRGEKLASIFKKRKR